MKHNTRQKDARKWFALAFRQQMDGNFAEAAHFYERSIEIEPSAEAHTFFAWNLSLDERFDEAIDECKKAIALDPDFGNPWNDIGAYLIELGKDNEAIHYLEQALKAENYDTPYFPHFNLSRIYQRRGELNRARTQLESALSHKDDYHCAREALEEITQQLH